MHAHEPGSPMAHDIRCDDGRILVYCWPDQIHILQPADRLEFDSWRWHGVVPLTIGATFTNTNTVEQAEFHSTLESPHNAPQWVMDGVRNAIRTE